MDFESPFLTYEGRETDPQYDSPEEETRELFIRQNLIFDFLEGAEFPDVVLDCLDEHGIDPIAYVNSVEESIDWIIQNNIKITDAGLWVPQS